MQQAPQAPREHTGATGARGATGPTGPTGAIGDLSNVNITSVDDKQILEYDEANSEWVNVYLDHSYVRVYNNTGAALSKGDVVYISGSQNANVAQVALAQADSSSTMPAIGVLYQDLANGAEGLAVVNGKADGMALPSGSFSEGDIVYVSSSTAGAVTATKPTGTALIQNLGIVMKTHASNGVIKVTSVGRSNDVPNIPDGQAWIGNSSGVATPTTLDSIATEGLDLIKGATTKNNVTDITFTGDLVTLTGTPPNASLAIGGDTGRLTDVDDTITPAAGDVLIFNDTSDKYEPQSLTEGTNITITNADGSITIAAPNYTAGDGLTLTGTDFDVDAAQTLITSILNSNLKLGTSATQEYIDFGAVSNVIRFLINNTAVLDITSGGLEVSGNVDVASNNVSVNGKVGDTSNNDHISFETDGEVNIMTNNVERMSVTDTGVEVGDLNTTRNIFEKTSDTDHDYQGDIVKFGTGTLQQGRLCYYSGGAWAAADADAESTSGGCLLGIALGSSPTTDGLLIKGMYTLASDVGTDGDELYVSTSIGQVTNTAPTGSGDVVRVVGYCLDSTNGQIWFNPSSDWIELS